MHNQDISAERERTIAAIDRVREEVPLFQHTSETLRAASCAALRTLASNTRAAAWSDTTLSADELDREGEDPGWAPNPSVRLASLLDHLAELSSPLGVDVPCPPSAARPAPTLLAVQGGEWRRMTLMELRNAFSELDGRDVTVFDSQHEPIARATSWSGEIVEVLDVGTLDSRLAALKTKVGSDKDKKKHLERLQERPLAWGEALVRAGFSRPHFGPSTTASLFARHVAGQRRVEITPDVNAIVNGAVHHLARVAPNRVDFARSAVTDLEIQRLADNKPAVWRKACRTLEGLPRSGPIWRSHSLPDATAMLVARAEQGGKKAPGADALLARNFEEARLQGHGVRQVLLTADNGLARTLSARMAPGTVWLAYVDRVTADQCYFSPLLSWPVATNFASSYSSLSELLHELLVCDVDDALVVCDGSCSLEIRSHLEGEHQYGEDWAEPHVYVRGLESVASAQTAPVEPLAVRVWPLRQLQAAANVAASGARVTSEQAATAFNLAVLSRLLNRDELSERPNARDDMWNFLKSIGVIDAGGKPGPARPLLDAAYLAKDMEIIREIILRFGPAANAVVNPATVDVKNRTVAAGAALATAAGLVSRRAHQLIAGTASPSSEAFTAWLTSTLETDRPIADVVEIAAVELGMSPIRFESALAAVFDDPRWVGTVGGGEVRHELDCDVLRFDDHGRLSLQELRVGSLLGLRSIARRS